MYTHIHTLYTYIYVYCVNVYIYMHTYIYVYIYIYNIYIYIHNREYMWLIRHLSTPRKWSRSWRSCRRKGLRQGAPLFFGGFPP